MKLKSVVSFNVKLSKQELQLISKMFVTVIHLRGFSLGCNWCHRSDEISVKLPYKKEVIAFENHRENAE